MKSGDPLKAWPDVPVKAYVQLTDNEKKLLGRRQKIILIWSILASFTYALIWYWLNAVGISPNPTLISVAHTYSFSPTQIGYLVSAFAAGFIITNFIWGHLNDNYWPYRIVTVGLIVAGLTTLIFPYVHSLSGMIAIRLVEGIFNGAAWSGLVKTVQLWFPIEKRSRYLGIMIAVYSWAISADELLGQSFMAATGGWQEWAIIVGILGLVVGAITFFTAKPYGPMVGLPHLDWGDVPPAKNMTFKNVSVALYKFRWMILAILSGFVVIGGANVISAFYIPDVLGAIHHMTGPQIGLLATVWGVGQGILILIFGPLSDRLRKRVIFIKIGLGGSVLAMIGVIYAALTPGLSMPMMYLITISTGWPFLIAGPVFALLADRYGVQMVGAASAHFEGFGTGGGAFVLPLIVGGMSASTAFGVTSPYPWVVMAAIFFVIFLFWLPQKDYTVSQSLVDVKTLEKEKREKEIEFGLVED
ncbi:hypothetical protein IX51_05195 [uncultured archaeon]|nr:hypothetical protein IX51_05195 [uncultured archaeon]HKJ96338.1 MFS transporter [Thermoplasmataceae archaeon]